LHDGSLGPYTQLDSPICAAFFKSPPSTPQELNYGDATDTRTAPLTLLTILDPADQRSKERAYVNGCIGGIREEGFHLAFTDGTGNQAGTASAVFSQDRQGQEQVYGAYLGNLASVADAERLAITLALENETAEALYILTDSQAALSTAANL